MAIIIYDPSKEMPLPRAGILQIQWDGKVYVLNPGQNEWNDEAIAEVEQTSSWKERIEQGVIKVEGLRDIPAPEQLQQPTSEIQQPPSEITPPVIKPTAEQRTQQLLAFYEEGGYKPIEAIAAPMGIAKPASGWKDAIALIVQQEIAQGQIAP